MTIQEKATAPFAQRHRGFMNRLLGHSEQHRNERIGWMQVAVLGANDGIVSTASLVLGVAAAGADHRTVLLGSVALTFKLRNQLC